ncbi:hypothetical protein SM19410_02710 [Xanthomonas hortorum pv. gardneri]|nr:hypothetical protein BJD10_18410 [Xanthomonas hortorum pv. gardneri]QEW15033.1 hypothetical protein DYQ48_08545 [Xanthomonas hortorum]APP85260.1 hypothetical protein BI317_14905 [Xanthomonas hortorum pv. gardneri]KLB01177.1 hypothetical protein SM17710_05530 [Xanthomonas hortorum pv. gardneri]KLB01633.1 hypothetical protein SM19410_02710 [Xanthomonas hortorum pv. gardneri]
MERYSAALRCLVPTGRGKLGIGDAAKAAARPEVCPLALIERHAAVSATRSKLRAAKAETNPFRLA